uniref:Uncharacterized protein n=1 Tax=Avena sativa TaxID=4498 RepID=A0ACD6AGN3_AVESA
MGEVVYTAAATVSSSSSSPVKDGEEQYVQVGWRFFRVKPAAGGGGAVTTPRASHHHFLDACFLCKRTISSDSDIFMYKGDAAFCGEECRQEQMSMDEALQAVSRRHRLLLHHRQAAATAEPAAGAARREAEASRPVMRRRPTIANIGAARTPVAAS